MSVPYKCPVCDGSGKVPYVGTVAAQKAVECHACNGKGIVWSPDAVYVPTPPPPMHPMWHMPLWYC